MTNRIIGIFSHINDGIIGYDGELVFTSPVDFANFRKVTKDKILLVGYKTAKEIFDKNPNGLPGRDIAILVSEERPSIPDHPWKNKVTLVIDPIVYMTRVTKPIVIAGGSKIFDELWPQVNEWHITHFKIDLDEIIEDIDPAKISRIPEDVLTTVEIAGAFDAMGHLAMGPDNGPVETVISRYLV